MEPQIADFSGYATKAGLKCSDGRTIMPDAFAHQDKMKVPLVWQHGHNEPTNVLGYAILENRDASHPDGAGTYAYGFFNSTDAGTSAKALVQHGDITALSIYANKLVERAKNVLHGAIREVSLVLSGANPGALIDNVAIAHSDGEVETLEDEAIIFTGLTLEHAETPSTTSDKTPANPDEETVQQVYDTLTDKQKEVVHYMIGAALEDGVAHSDDNSDEAEVVATDDTAVATTEVTTDDSTVVTTTEDAVDDSDVVTTNEGDADTTGNADDADTTNEGDLNHKEGSTDMTHNVFEQNGAKPDGPTLSHDQLQTIVTDAQKIGSFKEALLQHAAEYGITDIDMLFPDAKNVTSQPDLIARRTEWVKQVIDGSKHSPFSRIKSLAADLTAEEARAKGYVKGNLKKDEIIKLLKRVTTPTTVYKKQKLDRDDIVDITDLDVVAWLKWEMRFMLEEELARAILIGDGREPDDLDKIDEDKLRPIAWDDVMYAHAVNVVANITPDGVIEAVLRARKFYKGTGTPSFFTTDDTLTDMILIKDTTGRRLYNTEAELAAAIRVDKIVVVEVMENAPDLLGIVVNMMDYTIGADKGGALSMFDDFDIDYNQYKYLMETRISGALTKPKSAVVIKKVSGTTVTPLAPTYTQATHTIAIPVVTGVSYFDQSTYVAGVSVALTGNVVITETTDVMAVPNATYTFPHNIDADWTFAYVA